MSLLPKKTQALAMALALVLVAVAALGAVLTTAAMAEVAPRWDVENKLLLPTDKPKNFIAHNTEALRLGLATAGLKISSPKGECVMTGKIVGSIEKTPGTKKEVGLVCTNTTVVEPATGCTVKSPGQETGTVTTAPMQSTLVFETEGAEAAGELYSAEGKGPIGEIILEGAMCGKKGTYAIENDTVGRLTPVIELSKVATQAFPEPPILKWWNFEAFPEEVPVTRLTLGGKAALLSSSFEVKLNPEEKFSYWPS